MWGFMGMRFAVAATLMAFLGFQAPTLDTGESEALEKFVARKKAAVPDSNI